MSDFAQETGRQYSDKARFEWAKFVATGDIIHRENAEWHAKAAKRYGAVVVLDQPATTPVTSEETGGLSKQPLCHYRVIRRFYAICRECGLNEKEDERMRGALSMFFRRRVNSRSELTADNWQAAGDAIKAGLLVW